MFKFFTAAAALLASSVSAATVDDTCVIVDFTTQTSDFTALNNVVTIANTGLIALYVDDPLTIAAETFNATPFSVLGMDFTVTPKINSLSVTGLSGAQIKKINVTGSHSLAVGASFSQITANASISVELAQTSGTTDLFCFTDISNPSTCAPLTITGDVVLGVQNPTVYAGLDAEMYGCASGVSTSTCSNLTVTSILTAAISGDVSSVLTAVEKKFKNATITSLDFSFDSLTALDLSFEDTTTLLSNTVANSAISTLLSYSKSDINSKGDGYKSLVALIDVVGVYAINEVIQSELVPLFGASCL